MLDAADNNDKKDVSDNTVMYYDRYIGGSMSRLLITKEKEEKVQNLLALLKGAEKQPKEVVEIKKSSLHELVGLVELLLDEKAIVLEDDLSPTEAGEIAGISRPSIMHMLKVGRLKGYEVGTHWRITKGSLLQYMEEREQFAQVMSKMDEDGFGIDKDE